LIKKSQPFGKKIQKTVGGGFFFDSHCTYAAEPVVCHISWLACRVV